MCEGISKKFGQILPLITRTFWSYSSYGVQCGRSNPCKQSQVVGLWDPEQAARRQQGNHFGTHLHQNRGQHIPRWFKGMLLQPHCLLIWLAANLAWILSVCLYNDMFACLFTVHVSEELGWVVCISGTWGWHCSEGHRKRWTKVASFALLLSWLRRVDSPWHTHTDIQCTFSKNCPAVCCVCFVVLLLNFVNCNVAAGMWSANDRIDGPTTCHCDVRFTFGWPAWCSQLSDAAFYSCLDCTIALFNVFYDGPEPNWEPLIKSVPFWTLNFTPLLQICLQSQSTFVVNSALIHPKLGAVKSSR